MTDCYLSIWNLTPYTMGSLQIDDIEYFYNPTRAALINDFGNEIQPYSYTINKSPYQTQPNPSGLPSEIKLSFTFGTLHGGDQQNMGFTFKFWQGDYNHGIWVKSASKGLSYLTNGNGYSPFQNGGRLFSLCLWDQTPFRLAANIKLSNKEDVLVLAHSTTNTDAKLACQNFTDVSQGCPDNPPLDSLWDQWRFGNVVGSPSYVIYPILGLQSTYASGVYLQYKNGIISVDGRSTNPDPSMYWAIFTPGQQLLPGQLPVGQPQPPVPGFETPATPVLVNNPSSVSDDIYNCLACPPHATGTPPNDTPIISRGLLQTWNMWTVIPPLPS